MSKKADSQINAEIRDRSGDRAFWQKKADEATNSTAKETFQRGADRAAEDVRSLKERWNR